MYDRKQTMIGDEVPFLISCHGTCNIETYICKLINHPSQWSLN